MAMAQAVSITRSETVLGDRIPLIDAAQMLNMHHQSVRRLIVNGVIPAKKVCGVWAPRLDVIQMFMTNYKTRPGVKPQVMLL